MSCGTSLEPLGIKTEETKAPVEAYPRPRPVSPPEIEIKVVTDPEVLFGMTEDDYLELSQWMSDILRFIEQQNAILEAYETRATQE